MHDARLISCRRRQQHHSSLPPVPRVLPSLYASLILQFTRFFEVLQAATATARVKTQHEPAPTGVYNAVLQSACSEERHKAVFYCCCWPTASKPAPAACATHGCWGCAGPGSAACICHCVAGPSAKQHCLCCAGRGEGLGPLLPAGGRGLGGAAGMLPPALELALLATAAAAADAGELSAASGCPTSASTWPREGGTTHELPIAAVVLQHRCSGEMALLLC